jgi:excisionase family DNA binding protein
MEETQDNILTIENLSSYLKIPKSTLYKLAQDGKLPGQKIGKDWRFRRDVIDRWLEDNDARREKYSFCLLWSIVFEAGL